MATGCQRCGKFRLMEVGAKVSDRFWCNVGERSYDGYVPRDIGVGGDDYVEFTYCLDCGQLQGVFPLPETKLEATGVGR